MTSQAQAIFDEVLMWPPVERANLIEALISSFDAPSRKAVDVAWAREAESRVDAYEAGKLRSMSLDEALGRIDKT